MSESNELVSIIEFARQFHGHVGPYLIIGLKMGIAARKALNIFEAERMLLRAKVEVPLHPPFSCLLDGIQVSTTCTVGNQRLKIKNSKCIEATFARQQDTKVLRIMLSSQLSEQLKAKKKQNKLTEEFALEIAKMPENQLFNIEFE